MDKLFLILILTGAFDGCSGCGGGETIGFGGDGGTGGEGGAGGETTTSSTTTSTTTGVGATGGEGGAVAGGGAGGAPGGVVGDLCTADGDCGPGLTCEQVNPDEQGATTMCTKPCPTDGNGDPVLDSCGPGLVCLGTYYGSGATCHATCVTYLDCAVGFDCKGPLVNGDMACSPLPH